MKAIIAVVALLLAIAGAQAQDKAMITIQFDNRGSKVMSEDVNKKVTSVLAKNVFNVAPGNVVKTTGIGQSNLVNHQSVVTYVATGPTTNGKTALQNCEANTKGSFFRGSTVEKEIKKATDGWIPGDSVKVQSAVCAPVTGAAAGKPVAAAGPGPKPAGRKMM